MPNIEPLPLAQIEDPALRALIERGERLGVPDSTFGRILARVPSYAKVTLDAMLHSHCEGNVDHQLKEIIRILLARFARDPYFAALRSRRAQQAGLDEPTIEAGCSRYESDPRFTDAQKAALRYADMMYLDPNQVDAAMYAELKRHYSEAQIMELGAFIAFHYGMQVFMRTLDVQPQSAQSG